MSRIHRANRMSESVDGLSGLVLPPKVTGKVSGHLVMKVDEVLWARKPPGEVSAVVMWWGGDEPATFRPTDVAQGSSKQKNTGVIYEIRTSLSLFEKYLQKCGTLEIAVADKYGMPIGCASIPKLWQMSSMCPYQNYYPIVNNFGNSIGDLHVSFNLRMLPNIGKEAMIPMIAPKTPNNQGAKTKILKRLVASREKQPSVTNKSKEEKTSRNEEGLKISQRIHETKQTLADKNLQPMSIKLSDVDSDADSRESVNAIDETSEKVLRERTSPTNNVISQILEHGTKLRNAMTASVMDDASHLDFNQIHTLSETSPAYRRCTTKTSFNGTELFSARASSEAQASVKTCQSNKASTGREKKVLDYLSGKPMSELEEKEALEALRSISPTKDLLDDVAHDDSKEHLAQNPKNTNWGDAKENHQHTTMNVSDNNKINTSDNNSKNQFDLDSQLLSLINCIRITVSSLVLNSVGIKRVGSSPMRTPGSYKSSATVHPPGVTYFVEYKFPLGSTTRSWSSDVRYCSKRFVNDHEVMFGERTVHNLPSTWRSSVSEQAALGSLISSLSFKVCARHLHQRVPVVLGSAAPAPKPLLESPHLRHEFDLPVMAPDHLPVAQLRICLEFGRDRIHFGGLFDPENNSLGVRSPNSGSSSSLKKKKSSVSKSTSAASKKNIGINPTVTRTIHQKSLSATGRWRKGVGSPQVAQADRVIKQLLADATCKLQQSKVSESSSVPSSARPQINTTFSKIFMQAFVKDFEPSQIKSQDSYALRRQFLKHEIAMTFLQVINSNALRTSADQGLCVLYKFPTWSAMENESVEWISISTEPLLNADGIWSKSQSRIHSIILPESESLQTFLQYTFKMKGMSKDSEGSLLFSVCIRDHSSNMQDFSMAEAHLPLSCLSTLENAFKAAKSNPNFSSSSCSSIVFELPLNLEPSCKSQRSKQGSFLKLKIDYRHSSVPEFFRKSTLPHNHGDSIIERDLECDVMDSKLRGKFDLKFKEVFKDGQNSNEPDNSYVLVPNWARSPDKKCSSISNNQMKIDTCQIEGENLFINMHSRKEKSPHASWEPVPNHGEIYPVPGCNEDKSQYLTRSENYKSMSDLKNPVTTVPWCNLYKSRSFLHLNSNSLSSGDSKSDCEEEFSADSMFFKTLTQRDMLKKDFSPSYLSKKDESTAFIQHTSTNRKPMVDHHDKANQVTVVNLSKESQTTPRINQDDWKKDSQVRTNPDPVKVAQGSQTSPRIGQVVLKRDVGTTADLKILPSGKDESNLMTSSHCAEMFAKSSVDGAEQEVQIIDSPSRAISEVRNDGYNKEDHTSASVEEAALNQCTEVEKLLTSSFLTKVGVECALHLQQPLDSTNRSRDQGEKQFVFVSFNPNGVNDYISSAIGLNPVSISPAVINNGEPEWNWHSEIQLPSDLLFLTEKRLVFRIWQSRDMTSSEILHEPESRNLIGFSALDLTVLAAGLPLISGWFNVMDFSGACRGQIKLSVEPLEDISRIACSLPSLPSVTDVNRHSAPSVYLAHCAYPDFPSHVTQFTDMRVQKVTSQPSNQAMLTVLSNCQIFLQNCEQSNMDDSVRERKQTLNEQESKRHASSDVSIPKKTENVPSEKLAATKQSSISTTTIKEKSRPVESSSNMLHQSSDLSVSEPDSEIRDSSNLLREKLSELDKITENIKARLLSRAESAHITRSMIAPYGLPLEETLRSVDTCKRLYIGEGDTLKTANPQSRDHIQLSSHVHMDDKEKIVSHKQRKTWERQEDLIDFGALQINCEDEEKSTQVEEESPHIEDDAEWLSESALQQVFNPFFFNNILNSFNPNHSVQVIELDDIENSDDGREPQAVSCSSSKHEKIRCEEDKEKAIASGDQRRSRRGNETYRKEMPHFSLNDLCASLYSGRSALSAGDTDSGVDVDSSANFQSGLFSAQAESHNSRTRRRGESIEREESSSCSFSSSRRHQSTMPSSLSASAPETPTDSPQRSRQAPEGCNNSEMCQTRVVLGKRRSAS